MRNVTIEAAEAVDSPPTRNRSGSIAWMEAHCLPFGSIFIITVAAKLKEEFVMILALPICYFPGHSGRLMPREYRIHGQGSLDLEADLPKEDSHSISMHLTCGS